ncbi:questin oxidase family protein [Aspergillus homomorphus CBS 101889]|uniref:Oxidoreductase AflY n=1 Tax=Aspergillus homomorphus (strain CBS 101889) TaxID=1450537 RepID=A0A395IAG9_ASPHC|nr:hypothetical protein BO97DRAFT_474808 [Aspergillus homomorphus CBS 101889]RAL16799.1 hypothetical protein BO97DRAFT_474808 [Aspergillus homomorphus CBS 101889]
MTPKPTAQTIVLTPETTPGHVHAPNLTSESATLTSQLLTLNHKLYHTRWQDTFHNHLTHHLLALWSLGATPAEIQDMWEYNKGYQGPIEKQPSTDAGSGLNLKDPAVFAQCLGDDDRYLDFLRFFEEEIHTKGMETVVIEYLFQGDERADDILGRMFTDLVHPIIHLGCGIEFQQPALVAEALAGACVHVNWPKTFLLATEAHVQESAANSRPIPSRSLLEVLETLRNDPIIGNGVKANDPFNKIPDGFLQRVSAAQLAPHLGQFQVPRDDAAELHRKAAQMMYTTAYMLGAAQQPGKHEALDFVTLHCVTLAVFFPAFLAQDWLANAHKARLLEATARVAAVMYAGCACPPLYPERIRTYVPRHPADGWPELFHRAVVYRDEGHAAKLIRALYSLEALEHPPPADFPVTREDFRRVAHLAMDSIERAMDEKEGNRLPEQVARGVVQRMGPAGEMVVGNMTRWLFYGGLPGAWDKVPASRKGMDLAQV